MIILGDSIPKYVSDIEDVVLQSFSGDTIAKLSSRIYSKQVSWEDFEYVLIHVGTNDVDNYVNHEPERKKKHFEIDRAFDNMISDYGNLIGIIRKKKSSISILMSALLPRPKYHMDRVKRIWYLSPMRAAKVQASLRIRAVAPEPPLLAHTSSESRGTFRQKARSLAPLNGWACAVKICHDGMLEDTNSLDGAHMKTDPLNRKVNEYIEKQMNKTSRTTFL